MLNFKNITKTYTNGLNDNVVLDNVDILIEDNISLIIGESGVGKSTLLNIIGCLIKPDKGWLYYDDSKLNLTMDKMKKFRLNNFSYVFQDYNLLPEFTIYQNLLIPAYINNLNIKKIRRKIDEMLDYMKLEYIKNSYPKYISHGEKQRVSFLRSLLAQQKIVLADEPTGNLDKINTKIILDLIVNINKDFGYSFVIASHDKSFINISDNVFEIKNKKIYKYE
tara:strand:+ start:2222 stop:2887 length:666 start_codon:yes stop_codon:yes gene_type:complete